MSVEQLHAMKLRENAMNIKLNKLGGGDVELSWEDLISVRLGDKNLSEVVNIDEAGPEIAMLLLELGDYPLAKLEGDV